MDNGGSDYLGSIGRLQSSQEISTLLPVTCPICGTKSISAFPLIVVMTALTRWNNMALYASCHEGSWNASPAEIAGIRAFLGETWIDAHRHLLPPEAPPPSGA